MTITRFFGAGWLLLLVLTAAAATAEPKTSNAAFLKPDEAVAKMSIPDGFEVKVFAAEPDIGEPIAFCFDDRGRLWIAENLNYRTRGKHTDDQVSRIQIFEDADGDGNFDTKKTFTDKLTFTSGLAIGFGGVFVGAPPNLVFIPDADGDDHPDGPPQVLLDGWGINDRHETLNSFIWGPDGWLYGCHGVFTQSKVGKPGAAADDRQFIDGGIWRYHPTKNEFEIFARGLSNPWGFDFDDHGQGFATCCVIPHLFHVVQGGVYHIQSNRHVNPYVYDDIKTIRDHAHKSAHGGARFYLADAFPAKYHNRLFMCNIHEHAVLTDIMVPKGSSFVGKHGDDFLPTNDLAWVGFSVEIGPEGGVYIMDWHDTDICGNAINFPDSGRIYRIMPKNAKAIERPNLGGLSDEQLVDLQLHRNDWYVRQTRLLLHTRTAVGKLNQQLVHQKLREMLKSAPTSGKRLRAVWALHVTDGFKGAGNKHLIELLEDEDEYVRAWAIQLLSENSDVNAFFTRRKSEDEPRPQVSVPEAVVKRLVTMASSDPSSVVRLYLASAVQRLEFPQRWAILEGLASHEEDRSDNNIPRMLWFGLEPMVSAHPQDALKLAVGGKMPALPGFVARRIASGGGDKNANVRPVSSPDFQRNIGRAAPGFEVQNVGEGGVVHLPSFRNTTAVRTHPLNRGTPCTVSRNVDIPKDKTTQLKMRVSHHPHGDWQLRVLVDREVLADTIVSAKTVNDEWLDVTVDLSKYAGKKIQVLLENRANDWQNEWAYWHEVTIVSQ